MKTLKFATALVAALAAGSAFAADGDAKKGAKVFKKCKACHQIGEDAKNKIGPILTGFLGRPIGTVGGFKGYSKAFKAKGEAGEIWTEENFIIFITKPKKWEKTTKMSFAGLKKEKDRANLLAYLKAEGACAEEGCPAAGTN